MYRWQDAILGSPLSFPSSHEWMAGQASTPYWRPDGRWILVFDILPRWRGWGKWDYPWCRPSHSVARLMVTKNRICAVLTSTSRWWDHAEGLVRMVLEWDFGGGSVYTFDGRLSNEVGNECVTGNWQRNKGPDSVMLLFSHDMCRWHWGWVRDVSHRQSWAQLG